MGMEIQIIKRRTRRKSLRNKSERPWLSRAVSRGKAAVEIAEPTNSTGAICKM